MGHGLAGFSGFLEELFNTNFSNFTNGANDEKKF